MKHFLTSIALIISSIIAIAQPTWKNISDTRFVRKIVPDGEKIWLSSEGGLMCINKTALDTIFYNHANSGMPFTNISDMCLDTQGRLWLTSNWGGIACKDGENWIAYDTSNSTIPNNRAFSITCDSQGIIWAHLYKNLMKYDGNTWTAYDISFIGTSNGFNQLAIDVNNRVLLNGNGIWAFDGTNFIQYDTSNSPIHENRITYLKTFPDGKTWIGHLFSGLTVTDFTTWSVYDTLVTGRALNTVSSFEYTPDGNYWLGSSAGDLYYFDGISWSMKMAELPVDTIRYITYLAVDNANNLYVSAHQCSLFDGNYWYYLNTAESAFKGNIIEDIFHASDNSTWLANYYGMTRFNGNQITNFNADDSSSYVSVACFAEDHNGKIYAAHNRGISVYTNNEWHHLQIPVNQNLFLSVSADHLSFDVNNSLFLVSYPGIIKYDGINIEYFSSFLNNFPASEIFCMISGPDGHIYAGFNNGMAEWNGNTWIIHMIPDPPVYDNKVWDIAVYENNVWMATSGGLIKFDGNTWEYYNPENCPLPNYYTSTVDCDTNGVVWLMNGITDLAKFDGQNWQIIDYNNSGMLFGHNRKLRVDNSGNVWLGGMDCAISIYNENGIYLDTHELAQTYKEQDIINLVYPNPTSGEIKISYKLPDDQQGWMIIITDLEGKNIDNFSLREKEETLNYSAERLTSGQYYISVSNGKSIVSTAKVQVIR